MIQTSDKKQIAALYIRVSTDMQIDLSPDAQKRELLNYAKEHHYMVKEEFIFMEEQGISGKRAEKRPAFQNMIALAKTKPKPFDVVLVWKFSRFARNQDESTFYKGILRKKCNIDVISISEPIVEGMFGRLIELIIEWNDEYYSYNLANEVTRGMTERAMRGGYQAKPPLGYVMTEPGKAPSIVPAQAEIIKLIFYLYVHEQMSLFQIAQHLNQAGFKTNHNNSFEKRSIAYIIQNPTYIGKIRWNRTENETHRIKDESEWIVADGQHEAIIEPSLFYAAQERYKKECHTVNARPSVTYKHWLSGLLKCSNCGRSLSACSRINKHPNLSKLHWNFQCYGYTKGKCLVSHSISDTKLEHAVLQSLQTVLYNHIVNYCRSHGSKEFYPDRPLLLDTQLDKLRVREQRIKDAYIHGIDSLEEYKRNKQLILEEKEHLLTTIPSSESSIQATVDAVPASIYLNHSFFYEEALGFAKKNELLKRMVRHIIFQKKTGSLEIYYYLPSKNNLL
ncbi:recombinase family protein [Anaeromicropila populeti]|uniref:Site-specific DNA recombinase n=1 Tax=Anaeromicropila populeti TaxID=37658 RepID=A0A1I6KRE5_9FIRM|nr:recombinase family protein [Anaeromicropila populeti]SFR93809.1 Site-specific DNA recombinase [Anaeromicropila populeti]